MRIILNKISGGKRPILGTILSYNVQNSPIVSNLILGVILIIK
jgi:hypothetical protein